MQLETADCSQPLKNFFDAVFELNGTHDADSYRPIVAEKFHFLGICEGVYHPVLFIYQSLQSKGVLRLSIESDPWIYDAEAKHYRRADINTALIRAAQGQI